MLYMNGKRLLFSPHIHLDGYENGRKDLLNLITENGENFSYMFCFRNINEDPGLDLSTAKNLVFIFTSCRNLTTINNFNAPMCEIVDGAFADCIQLVSIYNIDISNVLESVDPIFGRCESLENLTFIGPINISVLALQDSPKLTIESLRNIINALTDFSDNPGQHELVLNIESLEKLTDDDLANISSKGWEVYS